MYHLHSNTDDNRHCTDICCLIIGTIFSLAVIGVPLYFVQPWKMEEGNIRWRNVAALNFPTDSEGKICGFDYPEHQYVYFVNAPEIVPIGLYIGPKNLPQIMPIFSLRSSIMPLIDPFLPLNLSALLSFLLHPLLRQILSPLAPHKPP